MEIKINIQKGHLWILTLLLIGIAFVIGQSTLTPQQFGHSANQISVTLNGAQTTLQNALNTLSGSSSSQMATGTYTGDGSSRKFIAAPGINTIPSMIFVIKEGASPSVWSQPIFRINNQGVHGDTGGYDNNFKWVTRSATVSGDNLKGIQQGTQYGFYVTNQNVGESGSSFTANDAGAQYSYFVIVPAVEQIFVP